MRLDDPGVVREEYASEARLAARKAAHELGEGPDAREIAFAAIEAARPERVLEVGCGEGELAERVRIELGCEVTAIDQSERMVALARARGLDARLGDVQALPFADGEFECAVAAWMLFHVPNVERALSELARVLRPGGTLVAVTNGRDHLLELKERLGLEREPSTFDAEDAGGLLAPHFVRVEKRDAAGWLPFRSRNEAQAYVDASIMFRGAQLPDFEGPLKVRRAPVIFIAHKA